MVEEVLEDSLHAQAGGTPVGTVHAEAGNVNVGVLDVLFDEVVEEGGGLGSSCPPDSAYVVDVGRRGGDVIVGLLEERQGHQVFSSLVAALHQGLLQLTVIRVHPCCRVSQGDQHGPRQRAHLDQLGALVLLLGI